MTVRLTALLATCLAVVACTAPQPPATDTPLPQRIVLHYDFAGDWAATAGDRCEERVDISEGVFLGIAAAPDRGAGAFHVERFFMLETGQPAEALVGVAREGGALPLTVETEGVVDGRAAAIVYELVLEPEDPRRIRLTTFTMTLRDGAGQTVRVDLLADATARGTVPVLAIAGESGLCLQRL